MRSFILLLGVVAVFVFLPSGCGKPKTIVGAWDGRVPVSIGGMNGVAHIILTFKADGTMTENTNGDMMTGTYTLNGNTLHMVLKSGGGEDDETDTVKLDGDELTFQTFFVSKEPTTFSRQ